MCKYALRAYLDTMYYLNLYVLKWFGVKFTINLTLNHFNICRFDWDEYMTIKQVSSSFLPTLSP